MTAAPIHRLHYLDAMRSVLMLLGLLLHSSRPYDTNHWRVKDPQQIPLLDGVVATLQLFRMPGFFLIAGFFAMYLITRRSTPSFLLERMQRALVPLVTVLLSLNVAQLWFVARQSGVGTENFVADTLLPALWSGQLVSHLWFLACLAVYFAAVALLAPYLRRLATLPSHWSTGRVGSLVFHAALAVAVIAPLGIAVVAKLTAPALNYFLIGLVNVSTLLGYLPFFGFGVMLCAFPAYFERFATIDTGVIGVASCAAAGIYLGMGREGTAWQALHIVAHLDGVTSAFFVVPTICRQAIASPSLLVGRQLFDLSAASQRGGGRCDLACTAWSEHLVETRDCVDGSVSGLRGHLPPVDPSQCCARLSFWWCNSTGCTAACGASPTSVPSSRDARRIHIAMNVLLPAPMAAR